MKQQLRVNEIFYSLQGEGRNTGRAAVFVRFAGCNLRCSFCDTEFDTYREMTAEEIVAEVDECRKDVSACDAYSKPLLVLTGGEPTLQVDEAFVELFHQHGYEVAMESNGILPAPKNLDWLTVSPKGSGEWREESGERREESGKRLPDEIKIVFDEDTPVRLPSLLSPLSSLHSSLLYLQPCDTGDAERNAHILHLCIEYIKQHPCWRLSLQTHKLTGIK